MLRPVVHLLFLWALALEVSAGSRRLAPNRNDLVGRWRSDTAPTGYWIIDRYPDGRFAKRGYLVFYQDKPAELTLEWGSWTINDGRYCETILGTTSHTIERWWVGRVYSFKILDFDRALFSFENHEGHPRIEKRLETATSLLQMQTPPPADAGKQKPIDTISPSHQKIPLWVDSSPQRNASNQSMKPTAPPRNKFSVLATTPCRGLSPSR
jgi:hypothetical protein